MTGTEKEDFKLTFEIAIIEHLGLNLYSEVHSAVSELVANAYDADASKVKITLPLGIDLGLPNQFITVEDDGHGMTYQEARDNYLKIGFNRRSKSRMSKSGNRKVIGKKGIGKLAGFGIADQVTITTISDHKKTVFLLNLKDIRASRPKDEAESESNENANTIVREYHPSLLAIEEATNLENGTTITLEKIRPLDSVDVSDFKTRLSRKFAIFGDDFKVTIVDSQSQEEKTIEKYDVPTQIRYPEPPDWTIESINTHSMGKQQVKYWIGFTHKPIHDDAFKGITVISNGKSVQEPFDFKQSGGTEGQFGLQYMTGEVVADWLDENAVDVIASDRASVRWSDPDAAKLLVWGRAKVEECLKAWVKTRANITMQSVSALNPEIERQVESYQGEAKEQLKKVIERVASTLSQTDPDRTTEVVSSIVDAYRHDYIRQTLSKIADGEGGLELFIEALREWDLIDAVLTFQELSVKLSAIRTLRILILGEATEVKSKSGNLSLHEHLAVYPWLIDPMYADMEHEISIDKFILEHFGENPSHDDKRADFILLYNSDRIRIIEIKSAKDPVDERGLGNLMDYHHRIKEYALKSNPQAVVESILIYNGNATPGSLGMLDLIRENGEYKVYTWTELLNRNERIYKEQLKHVKEKNPYDPRVVELEKTMKERYDAVE